MFIFLCFLSGFSLLATSVIELIPLAVCYGVFLYLGISSLSGIQFMEQIKLVFVPMKYHPNKKYIQNVSIHLRSMICANLLQCILDYPNLDYPNRDCYPNRVQSTIFAKPNKCSIIRTV